MIKLFVGGFPLDIDEQQLAELIAPHGDIVTVKMVRDKKTRICKGYGFVEVSDRISAENVILALNGQKIGDRELTVSIREEERIKPILPKPEAIKKKRPRRIISLIIGLTVTLVFASWGRTGHSTIGRIAETHLTPQAKIAVNALLGGQDLADVASWADDSRDRSTASWHFINVELGLSYDDFKKQVEAQQDVYTALQQQEAILANAKASSSDRATALKYIVHFVGDIHQPMHVSRAEDKGGNTIQLQYDGRGTNLHSLWDTKMLEHAGLNDLQLAQKFDTATPVQIKKWQADPQMTWAWESYQISNQLYAEIDKMKGRNINDAYYASHLLIVQQRIEKAGTRLAGLLNSLLANTTITPNITKTSLGTVKKINVTEAANHYDERVTVTAKVFGTKDFGSMVLVNLGAAYPDSPLTVVLRGDAKSLGSSLEGKTITVTGKVAKYKEKPEIVVTDKGQVKIN